MFKELDNLLHSQSRLAIMSILMSVAEAEFVYLKEVTKLAAGNLSIQLDKLQESNYISIKKGFRNNYPITKCSITKTGRKAFELYVKNLMAYIEIEKRTKANNKTSPKSKKIA
jgi:DNA-binding MarR family transcriptional regulator